MYAWALIAIMAVGKEPELIGTYTSESECKAAMGRLEQGTAAKGNAAPSACYLIQR